MAFLNCRALSDTAARSCGDPVEDWLHVLYDFPLYADLRDLDKLGVQRDSENWTFRRILEDEDELSPYLTYLDAVLLLASGPPQSLALMRTQHPPC